MMIPQNILIIKPGAIGDLLHITPTIRALKTKFPNSRIDVMVGSRDAECLFENNPHINRVMFFDRKGEHRRWKNFYMLCKNVGSSGYDLVINFQRSTFKVWLLVLSANSRRILVYHKSRKHLIHAVLNHLETVSPLGIAATQQDPALELYPSAEDLRLANAVLRAAGIFGKRLIAFNLGASNRIKCWRPASFALLAERLTAIEDVAVVLIGGRAELDLAAQVMAVSRVQPCNLVNCLTLTQLGALLQQCHLLVSGDTGPLHLCTAVGTPVIALFGAIDPKRTGPVGKGHVVISHPELSCVPCNDKLCRHNPELECMDLITVDEVFNAVVTALDRNGRN
jgi:ADP-heptose:LPS heptosyltransferase